MNNIVLHGNALLDACRESVAIGMIEAKQCLLPRGIEVPDGTVTRVSGVTPNGKFWVGSGSKGAFVVRLP